MNTGSQSNPPDVSGRNMGGMRMKLSIYSGVLDDYSALGLGEAERLKIIRDCGFTCVDYTCSDSQAGGDWKALGQAARAAMEEAGVAAVMGHAPDVDPRHPENWADNLLGFCREAGIPKLVIHPCAQDGNTREEFFDGNTRFYRSLIPAAERHGVGVLIENIGNYADPYFLWNGADLRELIDRVDHPLFTACWDVGHANHFFPEHCNQYDSIMALGDKLSALHVHDNCGYFEDPREHHRIDMHTMPYASPYTCVNYDAVLQGLKDVNYSGTFNFEVSTACRSRSLPFVHRGEERTALALPPIEYWKLLHTALYVLGRHMLESYDMFDE